MSAYATMSANAHANASAAINGTTNAPQRTLTGLKRWSCLDKYLPSVESIKHIHIYDFDNTLFASPLPNKQIWSLPTVGSLANPDLFVNGGWWHNPSILAATGEGVEVEEPRAWKGWWNEQIAELVELSMQQKDVVTVMLTGRAEPQFADLVCRMVKSRGLDFDMACLKPAVGPGGQIFASTMAFKQELLRDIVFTYREAEVIKVYEDRPKHTEGFRRFFNEFNRSLMSPNPPVPHRANITAEVVQVPENAKFLDPTTEISCIQSMVNEHNLAVSSGTAPKSMRPQLLKRTVLYTGYLIPSSASEQLTSLVNLTSTSQKENVTFLANNVLIMPRPVPQHVLNRVGGLGAKMRWRVVGFAYYQKKVWAARVEPVPSTATVYTDTPTHMVVLALHRGARPADANRIQNWQPVPPEQAFEFDTTVGEKVLLRIEEEPRGHQHHHNNKANHNNNWNRNSQNTQPRQGTKRPFDVSNQQDFPTLGGQPQQQRQPLQHANTYSGNQNTHSTNQNQNQNQTAYQGNQKRENRGPAPSHNNSNAPARGGGNQNQVRGRGNNRGGGRGRGGYGRGGGNRGRGRGGGGGGGYAYKSLDDMNQNQSYGGDGGSGVFDGY